MKSAGQPLVSIITPFYNVEKFLQEAVESVLNQSYENWELFLIDDGSADGSTSTARELEMAYYKKITYLSHKGHENKGASESRNLGLSKANGDFVAFLDADDVWLPGKLAHQMNIMKNTTADMICGATLYWNSWAGINRPDKTVIIGCRQNSLYKPPELTTILYPLGIGSAPSMNGLLVKRSIIKEVGGFVDEFNWMYGDQAFLGKLYLRASVFVSGECYDKYRQRPDSICGSVQNAGDYHTYRLKYLKWFKFYLKANNFYSPKVEKALNHCLLKYEWPKYYEALQAKKKINSKVKTKLRKLLTWFWI